MSGDEKPRTWLNSGHRISGGREIPLITKLKYKNEIKNEAKIKKSRSKIKETYIKKKEVQRYLQPTINRLTKTKGTIKVLDKNNKKTTNITKKIYK